MPSSDERGPISLLTRPPETKSLSSLRSASNMVPRRAAPKPIIKSLRQPPAPQKKTLASTIAAQALTQKNFSNAASQAPKVAFGLLAAPRSLFFLSQGALLMPSLYRSLFSWLNLREEQEHDRKQHQQLHWLKLVSFLSFMRSFFTEKKEHKKKIQEAEQEQLRQQKEELKMRKIEEQIEQELDEEEKHFDPANVETLKEVMEIGANTGLSFEAALEGLASDREQQRLTQSRVELDPESRVLEQDLFRLRPPMMR